MNSTDRTGNGPGTIAPSPCGRPVKSGNMRPTIDRLPPHSIEAEQGVLGCCLLDAIQALPEAQAQLGSSEAFYDSRHKTIWTALCDLADDMESIDLITVQQRLKNKNQLEVIGGITYLTELSDGVPSVVNVTYYLEIIVEKWQLRRMVQTCTKIVGGIYDCEAEPDELIDRAERDVLAVRTIKAAGSEIQMARVLVQESIEVIEAMWRQQGSLTGLATGFLDLDRMTDGLQPGEMTIIAALPSVGKTSWAMNVAEHVAVDLGQPIGIFSVEMTAKMLVTRLICSRARMNLRTIRAGFISEKEFPKLTSAATKIAMSKMHFIDQSDLSIGQLRALARRMAQQHGIVLFVVDYLQLLTATGQRVENKTQETAAISAGLKKMAKELNVHVIAASQLTKDRDGSTRCRNAAEITQDADNLFVLTPDSEGKNDVTEDGIKMILDVRKQRNGPTGRVHLVFFPAWIRFENVAKISDEALEYARKPYSEQ